MQICIAVQAESCLTGGIRAFTPGGKIYKYCIGVIRKPRL